MIDNDIKFGHMEDGAPLRIAAQKRPGPNPFPFFSKTFFSKKEGKRMDHLLCLIERIEKWKNIKYCVFNNVCLVENGKVEI